MANEQDKVIKIICVFFVFFLTFYLRFWNLNQMGRTWDEEFYVDQGNKLISAILKGNFKDGVWYKNPDPPALPKYIFGAANTLNLNKFIPCESDFCNYDFTSARLASVLLSSLTILLVIFIGWEYISFFVGIIAGAILAMLPIFLGLSQLVTIESILIFFFTASVYSFLHLLNTFSLKNIVLCGILLGLAIGTKYTNVILIPLFVAIYLVWHYLANNRGKLKFNTRLIYILPISLITFIAIWPIPWLHLAEVWQWESSVRFSSLFGRSIPEVFFGRLMLVPVIYYFIYFLITTPFFILLSFFVGVKKILGEKKWILCSIMIWFLFPFVQSFISLKQHGVRYIIEIYVPMSLIAAIGVDAFMKKYLDTKAFRIGFVFCFLIYSLIILRRITPYYLDYFNVLVGGAKGVYQSKSFQLGWWGQGVREAGLFISNKASKGSVIGVAISPDTVMPHLKGMSIKKYKEGEIYDYVIVNYYNILREGFNDLSIKKNYKIVHNVFADGAILVTVYKHK